MSQLTRYYIYNEKELKGFSVILKYYAREIIWSTLLVFFPLLLLGTIFLYWKETIPPIEIFKEIGLRPYVICMFFFFLIYHFKKVELTTSYLEVSDNMCSLGIGKDYFSVEFISISSSFFVPGKLLTIKVEKIEDCYRIKLKNKRLMKELCKKDSLFNEWIKF